jgi:hypothetical protein
LRRIPREHFDGIQRKVGEILAEHLGRFVQNIVGHGDNRAYVSYLLDDRETGGGDEPFKPGLAGGVAALRKYDIVTLPPFLDFRFVRVVGCGLM